MDRGAWWATVHGGVTKSQTQLNDFHFTKRYRVVSQQFKKKSLHAIKNSSLKKHSSKKKESSRKTSMSALLAMPKPLTVWITINSGKF